MNLIRILYLSSVAEPMSDAALAALVAQARSFNAANDVSGMLLFAEGNFLQVLEGDEREVDELFERISRDPRHRNLLCLERAAIERREFAGWDMGFRHLAAADGELPDWLHGMPGTTPAAPREGLALLHQFGGKDD